LKAPLEVTQTVGEPRDQAARAFLEAPQCLSGVSMQLFRRGGQRLTGD
jgi:hypothetical protein